MSNNNKFLKKRVISQEIIKKSYSIFDFTQIYEKYKKEFIDNCEGILIEKEYNFLKKFNNRMHLILNDIYGDEIYENKEFQSTINKVEKTFYSDIYKEMFNTCYNTLKRYNSNKNNTPLLNNFRCHCNYNKIPIHTCKGRFILVSDQINKNKILYVICINCKMCYYENSILMYCQNCNIEFYSSLTTLSDKIYPPATWEKYHCNILICEQMSCIKCGEKFFLKNTDLYCKKCKFTINPMDILWKCVVCKKEFQSYAKIFNPLEFKVTNLAIKNALLDKKIIKPIKMGCNCYLKDEINQITFYHNFECDGILYHGIVSNNDIVVCSKCKKMNLLNNYFWFCSLCKKKFKCLKFNIFDYYDNENNSNETNETSGSNQSNNIFNLSNNKVSSRNLKNKSIIGVTLTELHDKLFGGKNVSIKYNNSQIKSDNLSIFNTEKNDENDKESINNKGNKFQIHVVKKKYSSNMNFNKFKKNKFGNAQSDCDSKEIENENEIENDIKNEKGKDLDKTNEKDNLNLSKSILIKYPKTHLKNLSFIQNKSRESSIEKKENETPKQNNFRKIKHFKLNLNPHSKEKMNKVKNDKGLNKNLNHDSKSKEMINKPYFEKSIEKEKQKIQVKKSFYESSKRNYNKNNSTSRDEIETTDNEVKYNNLFQIKNHCKTLIDDINILRIPSFKEEISKRKLSFNSNNSIDNNNNININNSKLNYNRASSHHLYSKSTGELSEFNFDDYTIITQIGQGTFGKIYLVQDINGQLFSMKKIILSDELEIEDLIKEYNLTNKLVHPNIIKILGLYKNKLDKTTYVIYILMEVGRTDWEKEIKHNCLLKKYYPEEDLIIILKQLSSALAFLQRKRVSHRDIKPQNILAFKNKIYKIADFGEAKQILFCNDKNTLRGTELYMSPLLYNGLRTNQIDIKHNLFKSDVYSLGLCVLYAATLNINYLYQIRKFIDMNTVKIFLFDLLQNKYSKKFIDLLSLMLEINENNRPDFLEMERIMNVWKV